VRQVGPDRPLLPSTRPCSLCTSVCMGPLSQDSCPPSTAKSQQLCGVRTPVTMRPACLGSFRRAALLLIPVLWKGVDSCGGFSIGGGESSLGGSERWDAVASLCLLPDGGRAGVDGSGSRPPRPQVGAMVSRLQEYGIDKRRTDLVHGILRYCGSDKRLADVFSNKNFYARATSIARGLKGVENVYTQHVPILNATVEAAVKGKLPVQDYPEISDPSSTGLQPQKAPREVIVFVIGGTTYEESRFVAQMNSAAKKGDSSNGSARVLLGGTAVCNGKSFLSDFEAILAAEH